MINIFLRSVRFGILLLRHPSLDRRDKSRLPFVLRKGTTLVVP
jgi:hypothetical protein